MIVIKLLAFKLNKENLSVVIYYLYIDYLQVQYGILLKGNPSNKITMMKWHQHAMLKKRRKSNTRRKT